MQFIIPAECNIDARVLTLCPNHSLVISVRAGIFSPVTWNDANAHCEDLGLKILTIDSQEEEDYVVGTINPTDKYCERLKSQNRVSTEHKADWQSWQAVSSSTGYK